MITIAIIGPGCVGLPPALQCAGHGGRVPGLDIDPAKTEAMQKSRSHIAHVTSANIAAQDRDGLLEASTDFSCVADARAVSLCASTPLNQHREPDPSHVLITGDPQNHFHHALLLQKEEMYSSGAHYTVNMPPDEQHVNSPSTLPPSGS